MFAVSVDFDQFDVEYQNGIRTDFIAKLFFSVSEFGRNIKGSLAACFQKLQTFYPARYGLVKPKRDNAAYSIITYTFFTAVEDSTVNQAAFIFDMYEIVFPRLSACTLFDHFVLQTGCCCFHALFSGIFFQKSLTFFFIGSCFFLVFFRCFSFKFCHDFHLRYAGFQFTQFSLFTIVYGLYGVKEGFHINFETLFLHLLQGFANVHTHCIAAFFIQTFER